MRVHGAGFIEDDLCPDQAVGEASRFHGERCHVTSDGFCVSDRGRVRVAGDGHFEHARPVTVGWAVDEGNQVRFDADGGWGRRGEREHDAGEIDTSRWSVNLAKVDVLGEEGGDDLHTVTVAVHSSQRLWSHPTAGDSDDDQPRGLQGNRPEVCRVAPERIVGGHPPPAVVASVAKTFHEEHVVVGMRDDSPLMGPCPRPADTDHPLARLKTGSHRVLDDDETSDGEAVAGHHRCEVGTHTTEATQQMHGHRQKGSVPNDNDSAAALPPTHPRRTR